MLSYHLFFCLLVLFTVPCSIVFAVPEDLEMWPYHLSSRFFTMVRRSSCTPIAFWVLHKRERKPNVKQVPHPLPPLILWVSVCLLIMPGKGRIYLNQKSKAIVFIKEWSHYISVTHIWNLNSHGTTSSLVRFYNFDAKQTLNSIFR